MKLRTLSIRNRLIALVALIAIIFLPNTPLGNKTTSQLLAEKERSRVAAAEQTLAETGLSANGEFVMTGSIPVQARAARTDSGNVDSRD